MKKNKKGVKVPAAGGDVFVDLGFSPERAAELRLRSEALRALDRWIRQRGLTQEAAAKLLGTTQARISNIKRGRINQFSLDILVIFAVRAGLHPQLKIAA